MRVLLDTCALSDRARPAQFPRLADWLGAQATDDLAIAALTVGELRYGVQRLSPGRKRERLTLWLDTELLTAFTDRILRPRFCDGHILRSSSRATWRNWTVAVCECSRRTDRHALARGLFRWPCAKCEIT
jgi:predicted nucleic acid-binding protein